MRDQDVDHNVDTDPLSSRSSQPPVSMPDAEALPYLLLDVRTEDDYKQSHIIGGLYPKLAQQYLDHDYWRDFIITTLMLPKNKT